MARLTNKVTGVTVSVDDAKVVRLSADWEVQSEKKASVKTETPKRAKK